MPRQPYTGPRFNPWSRGELRRRKGPCPRRNRNGGLNKLVRWRNSAAAQEAAGGKRDE